MRVQLLALLLVGENKVVDTWYGTYLWFDGPTSKQVYEEFFYYSDVVQGGGVLSELAKRVAGIKHPAASWLAGVLGAIGVGVFGLGEPRSWCPGVGINRCKEALLCRSFLC